MCQQLFCSCIHLFSVPQFTTQYERIHMGSIKRLDSGPTEYDRRYERIKNELVAQALASGAPRHWLPSFRTVHEMVMAEIEREKENGKG
jgi:hypothetical protein